LLLSWTDFALGCLLSIGLLYVFYLVDRKYVYTHEQLGFWRHLTTTRFFPKRLVAYLSVFGVTLAFINGMRPGIRPNTLTYHVVEFIFRISAYPFIILIFVGILFVLKIIFFPAADDPDRNLFFGRDRDK
jgi:hypothetical protein